MIDRRLGEAETQAYRHDKARKPVEPESRIIDWCAAQQPVQLILIATTFAAAIIALVAMIRAW